MGCDFLADCVGTGGVASGESGLPCGCVHGQLAAGVCGQAPRHMFTMLSTGLAHRWARPSAIRKRCLRHHREDFFYM